MVIGSSVVFVLGQLLGNVLEEAGCVWQKDAEHNSGEVLLFQISIDCGTFMLELRSVRLQVANASDIPANC